MQIEKLTKNMNPKIRRLFEKFIEQKIIINNIEDLKLHLQNIWENPLKWWNSDQIKVLRMNLAFFVLEKIIKIS